jgi:uncharacterized protein
MSVPARISIVTLGVDDLPRSKAFYEALGWEIEGSAGDEICWFRTADSYLGLFGREALAKDAALRSEPRGDLGGITLAINVESEEAVTAAFDAAVTAGARILKPATRADRGGYSGYFADPDGHPMGGGLQPDLSHRRGRPDHDLLNAPFLARPAAVLGSARYEPPTQVSGSRKTIRRSCRRGSVPVSWPSSAWSLR